MEASFGDFLSFWPILVIFGHFWPIFGKVPAGEPQISVEEGRFELGWCGNGPMLFLKSIGVGLASFRVFCHFWPFLAIFGPKISLR